MRVKEFCFLMRTETQSLFCGIQLTFLMNENNLRMSMRLTSLVMAQNEILFPIGYVLLLTPSTSMSPVLT